ncbi:hypothetical protein C5167_008565 [Papaver somniferum]|uniref:Uncharacterized protein n=1 Tax=Papaver somniferum TaxID=3469 RepID=A0A4Y7JYM6_PAPSO|nr:hypothetical protein C5167_008565 [Papaver somniferum]
MLASIGGSGSTDILTGNWSMKLANWEVSSMNPTIVLGSCVAGRSTFSRCHSSRDSHKECPS